jgi:hypothetical protein
LMGISRDDMKGIVAELIPATWRESAFLTPNPAYNISAPFVFDVLRGFCDPPMTEVEFNDMADEIARGV